MNASNPIDGTEDVIDSREVIARIEYLAFLDNGPDEDESAEDFQDFWGDEIKELAALRELADQGESFGSWLHGATLIRESYFSEYAQEYAEDIYDVNTTDWPYNHIDWDEAADDFHSEFSEVEFDGETYYIR